MQYLTVRELFHRWVLSLAPDTSSVGSTTYRRLFADLIDGAIGSAICNQITLQDTQRMLRDAAAMKGLDSAAAAIHSVHQAMAWAKIWTAEPVIYEPFSARSPIEIPLSAYQVAELVTKLPVNYRVPCHILLLTGLKPAALTGISMASFHRAFDAADEHGCQDHIQPVYVANHPQPIYLTNPVLSAMKKYVGKERGEEKVFPMTPNSIASTWNRYADDAPVLNRFKGTAATHLLRLGADNHALSANLGVSLAAADALIERLRPSKASQRLDYA